MATADLMDDEQRRRMQAPGLQAPAPAPQQTAATPGAAPNPGNNRESFHWERIPDAYRNIPGIQDWANDQSINPNDKVQAYLSGLRTSGGKVNEDDAGALQQAATRAQMGGAQPPSNWPGFQFDDPYTKMLEGVAAKQMGEVRSNPGLDQLLSFLNTQFTNLSQSPGYSPEEMAVLRTQAFEPVEQYRQASKQRALERTSARGMLPSSGLNELDLRDIDRQADQNRTRLDRDLAVAGIDRRDADLNRALNLGTTLGVTIPGQQRSEELALSSLLYDLPNKALQNALAVLNGSPTSNDVFSQAVQLANQNQVNRQNTTQRWAQIAQLLAGMDF